MSLSSFALLINSLQRKKLKQPQNQLLMRKFSPFLKKSATSARNNILVQINTRINFDSIILGKTNYQLKNCSHLQFFNQDKLITQTKFLFKLFRKIITQSRHIINFIKRHLSRHHHLNSPITKITRYHHRFILLS